MVYILGSILNNMYDKDALDKDDIQLIIDWLKGIIE